MCFVQKKFNFDILAAHPFYNFLGVMASYKNVFRDLSASSQKEQAEGVITNFVMEDIRSKTSFEKFISKFARFSVQGNMTW